MYEDLVIIEALCWLVLIPVGFSAFVLIVGILHSIYTETKGR